MSSSSRAALRREMEAHLGGPPNDPNRCITDCKVWPKGVEPPYCYCQSVVFRTYLVITRLLARGIGLVRISRKSKKQVQYHRYRCIFKYVCRAFIFYNKFVSFFVYESTLVMRRILIIVIFMSGLTCGSLIVISNIWRG